jgi:restriction endonuclease S subunit
VACFPEGPDTFFRLSPAARAEALAFGLMRGEIRSTRFDVNYWRLSALVEVRLSKAAYPPRRFGEILLAVQYGCSKLAKAEPPGTRMLRMNNLQADGWDLSDIKWVELSKSELEAYLLKPNDLLFNRTNSKELVGKCEVFREPGEWVFASYLIRVRTDEKEMSPQFASDFLNAPTGRLQIDQLSRQIIGMTNINAEEIKSIRVPLPSPEQQADLVTAMDAARAERRAKLVEADELLSGLDRYLLTTLGLTPPSKDDRKIFAVSMSTLGSQARLNADYFHPERILALRALEHPKGELDHPRLEQIVDFVRDQIKTPGSNYISLANVQSNTGELLPKTEEVTGACSVFQQGDVLFARLRPYLNKVHAAENDGCCSPEFHVLRAKESGALYPDYLAAILRSSLTLAQTRHMMTGNTHPRLTNEDVVNLVIPVPKPAVQETVVNEVRRRRKEARRLRADAEARWQAAKQWFEEQLLGPVQQ